MFNFYHHINYCTGKKWDSFSGYQLLSQIRVGLTVQKTITRLYLSCLPLLPSFKNYETRLHHRYRDISVCELHTEKTRLAFDWVVYPA